MARRKIALPLSATASDSLTPTPAKQYFTKPGARGALFTELIETVKLAAEQTNDIAKSALEGGDRKGVLAAMKAGTALVRSQTAIEKILARSERVRLTRDEKAAFAADGTLPEGVQLVTGDAGDDEDDELEDE